MDIELLRQCGKIKEFNRYDVICREGDEGHSLFLLLQGDLSVNINSYSDDNQNVGYISQGNFFGEMSLLEKKPRTASVTVVSEKAIVMEISENRFPRLLEKTPDIAYGIMAVLNKRLNNMLNRIWETDKKYVFQYRKNDTYEIIQKLDLESFSQIAKKVNRYPPAVCFYERKHRIKHCLIRCVKLLVRWKLSRPLPHPPAVRRYDRHPERHPDHRAFPASSES